MKILVLNCGSSSVKYKLFRFPHPRLIEKGLIEKIGEKDSSVRTHHEAIEKVFSDIKKAGFIKSLKEIEIIGHRVVHGGEKFKDPVAINREVIREIRKNIKLAPLHNPANLEGIIACRKILPSARQVAVFDTAFHQTIPPFAYIYALPLELYKKYKIRRYGFHGTSHHYVAHEAAKLLGKPLKNLNLITIHLGNGCSISAIKKGKCIDTSMGFTPLEGLVMGTRCGNIDTAIVFYLHRQLGMSIESIDILLNKKSGLLGVSGLSNDFRRVKSAADKGNKEAKLALDVFVYALKKYIGSYIMVLGKVDAVIFTAGIGENSRWVVREATKGIKSMLKDSPKVLVIPTNEELMIAALAYKVVKTKGTT